MAVRTASISTNGENRSRFGNSLSGKIWGGEDLHKGCMVLVDLKEPDVLKYWRRDTQIRIALKKKASRKGSKPRFGNGLEKVREWGMVKRVPRA